MGYHPEDSAKRKEEQKLGLNSRVEVFSKFLKDGKFDNVTVDNDQADSIVKVLDSVVILLEGGTDFDLQALERTEEEEKEKCEEKEEKPFVLGDHNEEGKPLDLPISKEQMELQKKAKEYLAAKSGGEDEITPNVSEQSDAAEKDENTKKK